MSKKSPKPRQLDLEEEIVKLDARGREVPDPTPMAPPVGYKKQPSMMENIRAMVRSEHLRQAAIQAGYETVEEADDFEVGDDFDPSSPYEHNFDPPEPAPTPPAPPPSNPPAAAEGAAGGSQNSPPAPPAPPKTP